MAPELPPLGDAGESERPPPAGWRRLYAFVVGMLAVEIVLLWLLARAFR